MGEAHEELRAAGADVVAVFQYRAEPTFHFCRKRGTPFDCLGDPQRAGYRAVGLERGGLRSYLGPQLAASYIRAARHGHMAGNPQGGDVAQRPGTFVVDPEGKVVSAHYNRDAGDHPDMDEIIRLVGRLGPQPAA